MISFIVGLIIGTWFGMAVIAALATNDKEGKNE